MRLLHLSIFTTLFLTSTASALTDDTLGKTIDHLLAYVEASDCVFIRNGREHNSREAAKHMKAKYEALRANITTPEEFIEKAASKSIVGGQPYRVRCADHAAIPSTDWLAQELRRYRQTGHTNASSK